MRELPILFSTEMVQAILDGRKTMTRRIVKPQPTHHYDENCTEPGWFDVGGNNWVCKKCGGETIPFKGGSKIHAPYQPGDRLYVRETWTDLRGMGFDKPFAYLADSWNSRYAEEDGDSKRCRLDYGVKWHPSIHMPKEAARIWLEVTNVRVERLREITEEDARAEGFNSLGYFRSAFDKILQKSDGSDWYTNPWVWVIEFKRI